MKLDTATEAWLNEARTLDYAGVMVVDHPLHGIDCLFIKNDVEWEMARENCEDNGITIVSEYWV